MAFKKISEFIYENKEAIEKYSKENKLDFSKFNNILAKTKTGESLESHTQEVLVNFNIFLQENKEIFKKYPQKVLDSIFFAVFLHDIGKATVEFYEDKIMKKKNSYHPLYALYFTLNGLDLIKINNIDFTNLAIISHHTTLHKEIYPIEKFNNLNIPTFFKEILNYLETYPTKYEKVFNKKCPYNIDFISSFEKNKKLSPQKLLRSLKKEGNEKVQNPFSYLGLDREGLLDRLNILRKNDIGQLEEINDIFGIINGNLIRADWVASGMNEQIWELKKNLKTELTESIRKRAEEKRILFDGLKDFQKRASISNKNLMITAPTGEGKTEAGLLWALNNLKNKHTKIIYAMPTQVTSNSLYKRFKEYFGSSKVGIVHDSSSLLLEEEIKDEDIRIKEKLSMKVFSKPITVCTLDSLILSFMNVHKWPLSTLYLRNSIVIIDEVHSYDLIMLGALKRLSKILVEHGNKICIMSATIPLEIKKELQEITNFQLLKTNQLFKVSPVSIKKIEDNIGNNDILQSIIENFNKNKKILVVVNTVEKAKDVYKKLKQMDKFETTEGYLKKGETYNKNGNLILYHSQYTKGHRRLKEDEIEAKEKENNKIIVIATQVVEISLDIDFEIMYSELCPIDSLIQRIGRINRRKKDGEFPVIICSGLEIYKKIGEKWAYPYPRDILDLTKENITVGNPSLSELSRNLIEIYKEFFNNCQRSNDFKNKMLEGYEKRNRIISEYAPYQVRFKTENMEEISKLLKIRDIPKSLEKIPIIPEIVIEKEDTGKFENTVDIPLWAYEILKRSGDVWTEKEMIFPIADIKYDYEYGTKINENHSADII